MRQLQVVGNQFHPARTVWTAATPYFTPAATPTDVLTISNSSFDYSVFIRKITVIGKADTSSTIDVYLQHTPNGVGGATTAGGIYAPFAGYYRNGTQQPRPSRSLDILYFTTNGTSRNGISSDRPLIAAGKMTFNGLPCVFDFGNDTFAMPKLVDLVPWIAVNLAGQTMPTNAQIQVAVEVEQIRMPRVAMCGDSTYSNAGDLMRQLYASQTMERSNVDNLGCNGQPLSAFITPGSTGIVYPIAYITNRIKDVVVIGYGINDVRTGATSQAQLISLINTAITNIRTAQPYCKIILHGPNPLTTDDPGNNNWLSLSGQFAGMTLAQAAQAATDIMYNAYESFRNDSRVYAIVHRQAVLGRTSVTVAQSGYMTDQLHPNAAGQRLIANQLRPVVERAVLQCFDDGVY